MSDSIHAFEGFAPVTHWGIIQASGADAVMFLHGQLTQDFALLDTGHARLAALCSAKGRMLASLIGLKRSPEAILLVCPKDILAPTLERLKMFVLRARCTLTDASEQYRIVGAAGHAAQSIGRQTQAPWCMWAQDENRWIALYPADGVDRALGILPIGSTCPAFTLSEQQWRVSDVRSGVASISPAVIDAYVPQMLNFESIGGVNFKKGCYPGQEVVARSQFRGSLKRRAYVAHSSRPMQAGQAIFSPSDDDQPSGSVVQAAQGAIAWHAIISLLTACDGAALTLDNPQGARLVLDPLPYPLLTDI